MKTNLTLIVPAILLFSSCATLLGVKDAKTYSDKEVAEFSRKYVHQEQVYRIDYDKFLVVYDSLRSNNPKLYKDLYQPMQIIVFNKERENITHLINCNVGGLPLKWNRTHSFDNFPLKANGLMEPTYKVSFQEISNFTAPYISDEAADSIFKNNDYLYVVYYSKSWLSLSKGMFRNLDNHFNKYSNKKIAVLYIFMEDVYVGIDEKEHE